MFRRVGNILVNLNSVSYIQLTKKAIEYYMNGTRFTAIIGSGGSDDIVIEQRFESEEEANKAFETIVEELNKPRKLM